MTTSSLILRALFGAFFLLEIVAAGFALLTVRRGRRSVPSDGPVPGASGEPPLCRAGWSPLDLFTVSALLGMAVTTVCGLVLAYLGLFGAGAVAALLAVTVAVVGLSKGRAHFIVPVLRRPSAAEALALLLAAGVVVYGAAFRFHEVAGLRDPGVYVNTGIELSRTGSLGWIDPTIRQFGFYGAMHLMEDMGLKVDGRPRWLRFSGYYLPEPDTGYVQPQFLHGYEVWVGLAYSLGGVQATQVLNAAFAALALLAIFGAVRAVTASQAAAAFTVVLLAASPAELWYARSPGNEIMIQALLWGFLLFHARALETAVSDGATRGLPQRRLIAGALALLGCATLVKIAAWLLLPAVAFDYGYQRARGRLQVGGRVLWTALFVLALAAFLHARLGAGFYYYGSWKFTAGARGISYFLFPVLFVGGTVAAFSLGMIAAPALAALGRRTRGRRSGLFIAGAVVALLTGAWLWQEWLLHAGIPEKQIWSDATIIAEFVFYFGPIPFVLGAAGLALLAVRRPTAAGAVFVLLLIGSSTLLVQRNLDANHPWAARRWVPFLIPAFLAGAGYLFALVWRFQPRSLWCRGAAAAGVLACAALLVTAAPQLVLTRNFYGAVPALDRLAAHLRPDDLILTQPSGYLMRWAPYLKARFDLDWYKHPHKLQAWSDSRPLLRSAAADGRRVVFVADAPLTMTATLRKALVPVHEEVIAFTELRDGIRRIETSPVFTSQTIALYEMRAGTLPRGWWPGAPDDPPSAPARRPLPVELSMGREAEPYIENVFDATEVAPGVAFRWTNGNFRLYLGELLELPLPADRGPLRITARLAAGRPEMKEPLQVGWYLDLAIKGRQKEITTTKIGADWSDVTVELDPALIRSDSYLELVSLRPPVGNLYPTGQLGHMIQSIRIE